MSSFICSDKTINSIVTYIDEHRGDINYLLKEYGYEDLTNSALAQELLEMNYQGTNARYGESQKVPHIKYRPVHVTPEQALKSMHCLHYQANEGNVPEKSKAYKFLDQLIGNTADQIVSHTKGYEEAEWNMSEKRMKA